MSDSTPQQPADSPAGPPPVPPAPPLPPYAQQGGYAPAQPAAPAPQTAPPAYAPPVTPAASYAAPASPNTYAGAPYGAKTNALAVVSLVAGILNFVFLFVIGAIVAVITGHIALKQLRTSGENGRGMALAGVILGWVGIGLTLIGVVFFIIWMVVFFGALSASTYSYS